MTDRKHSGMIRVACAILVCVVAVGLTAFARQLPAIPTLLEGDVPLYLDAAFLRPQVATLRLMVTNGVVTKVEPAGTISPQSFNKMAQLVRGWRFAPSWQGAFNVIVRYRLSDKTEPCGI